MIFWHGQDDLGRKKERVKDFRPIDDVFFEALASNKDICEKILRTILKDPKLSGEVARLKTTEGGTGIVCEIMEKYITDSREEGRKEGRIEGRKEGRIEGQEKLFRLLLKMNESGEAVDLLRLSTDEEQLNPFTISTA